MRNPLKRKPPTIEIVEQPRRSILDDLPVVVTPPSPTTDAREVDGFAPCRTCGGPVGMGGRMVGPWREHHDCATVAAYPPARLVAAAAAHGVTVTLEDASLVNLRVPSFAEVHPEPTWTEQPRGAATWRHVNVKAIRTALARLPELRQDAGIDPAPCVDGPCAWCGVVESTGWEGHGHRWPDGSSAPLCGGCSPAYVRNGSPNPDFPDDAREALADALTGVPPMLGHPAPVGLRAYVETDTVTTGEPWGHLPSDAVEAYRWWVWSRFGGQYAPTERRAEAARRWREGRDRHQQATVERDAQAALDPWGFGR